MMTYYDEHRTYEVVRLHPYDAGAPGQSGFVDFKQEPERIAEVLEDFAPFADRSAIQTFYGLLKDLNGPGSHLETCDCALRPPVTHNDSNSSRPLAIHGRLFLMFRDERMNCSPQHAEWLCGKLMQIITEMDVDFTANDGVLGFTLNPVLHTALSRGNWRPDGQFECDDGDPGYGSHTMLSFWAYGDDEAHAFANLDRVFKNLRQGCALINQDIRAGIERSADPDRAAEDPSA